MVMEAGTSIIGPDLPADKAKGEPGRRRGFLGFLDSAEDRG